MPETDGSNFDKAASLILDAVEQAFDIVAPNGREAAHRSIVAVLKYYTIEKPSEEQAHA